MSSDPPLHLEAAAYGRPVRVVRALLVVTAGASLPVLLVVALVATDPPLTPALLLRLFLLASAGPAIAAWTLRHLLGTVVTRAGDMLVVERIDRRFEIPLDAVARLTPWLLPLPGPGVTIQLRSGRRLAWDIELPDPAVLLRALGRQADAAHPALAYASARAATPPWRWYHLVAKFPLFAVLPTLPLFNVHQHIAYGGLWGQYYLLGARAMATDFLVHWTTVSIGLVLWAGLWRGLAEVAALGAACVAPSRAARVRRGAETACRWLYYGGVPLLVALRFAPW